MKYVEKAFLPPLATDRTPIQLLVDAVLSRNVVNLLSIFPRLDKNDINTPIGGNNDRRTVIHLACGIGAPEILQLLIWYNACINAIDDQGRSALWHAQLNGSVDCVSILKHNINIQIYKTISKNHNVPISLPNVLTLPAKLAKNPPELFFSAAFVSIVSASSNSFRFGSQPNLPNLGTFKILK
ncbi:hypothetical protein Mgra_00008454 [Meloidogyne graminicola]|uniref:ANK_REP_REGION domain-containing protein n=1 Tax=Meloidogyne graminicola TaxID=189291 RepID=A0A8S9ZFT0_9BILA|nr:hypothetical protein Mgra_00008454 [Meloidogyne graminicola]